MFNDPGRTVRELIFTPALFVIGWLVGYALRGRTEQADAAEKRADRAETEREAAARVAVAEERARIARELHDVVAHAVSVMVLQVGAVRHRMPAADSEDRLALENVEQAGRTALTEMRRLLGAMRQSGDELELVPHPGLDDLDALVAEVRGAGLAVQVDIQGEPIPLPPGLDLSAYRILQEGLTNTLKHAHARHAGATARASRVGTTGAAETARRRRRGGQSRWGHVCGVHGAGGFVLRARLPLDGARS